MNRCFISNGKPDLLGWTLIHKISRDLWGRGWEKKCEIDPCDLKWSWQSFRSSSLRRSWKGTACCLWFNHQVVLTLVVPWTIYSPPGSRQESLCSWDSPGKNTGVGCHSLLQGIFPTQGSSLRLLRCRWILYHWASWEPGMAGRVLTCLPGVLGSVQLQDLLQGLFVVLPLIFSFFHNLESDLTCQRGSENHQKE